MLDKNQLATAKAITIEKIPTLVKKKLKLKRGQKLGPVSRETKGRRDEDDIYRCDIIDAKGLKVGTVTYTASTSPWPPQRTSYGLVQGDIDGTVVVDTRW